VGNALINHSNPSDICLYTTAVTLTNHFPQRVCSGYMCFVWLLVKMAITCQNHNSRHVYKYCIYWVLFEAQI